MIINIFQGNVNLGCLNLSSTDSVQLSQFWVSKKTLQGWDGLEKTPHDQTLKWEMRSFLQSYLVDERPGMLLRYRSREGAEQGGEADHPTILIIRFKIIIGKNDKNMYTAGKARITLTLSPSIIEWTNFLSLVYPFHLLRDPCSSPPSSHVSTHRLLACFALIAGLAHTPQTAKLRGRR